MLHNLDFERMQVDLPIEKDGIRIGCFRLVLNRNTLMHSIPQVIVMAMDYESPIDWSWEVYSRLELFLKNQGIDANDCDIFLDMYQFVGSYKQSIYKWKLKKFADTFIDEVLPVSPNDLPFELKNESDKFRYECTL